jgi:hypothetical protein
LRTVRRRLVRIMVRVRVRFKTVRRRRRPNAPVAAAPLPASLRRSPLPAHADPALPAEVRSHLHQGHDPEVNPYPIPNQASAPRTRSRSTATAEAARRAGTWSSSGVHLEEHLPARAVPTSQGVSCTVLLASAALSAVVGHRTYVDAFNTRGACCVREMHLCR